MAFPSHVLGRPSNKFCRIISGQRFIFCNSQSPTLLPQPKDSCSPPPGICPCKKAYFWFKDRIKRDWQKEACVSATWLSLFSVGKLDLRTQKPLQCNHRLRAEQQEGKDRLATEIQEPVSQQIFIKHLLHAESSEGIQKIYKAWSLSSRPYSWWGKIDILIHSTNICGESLYIRPCVVIHEQWIYRIKWLIKY